MKLTKLRITLAAAMAVLSLTSYAQDKASLWLTKADKSALFEPQKEGLPLTATSAPADLTIEVDASKKYQTMDGFGFALTGGSAMHLIRMDKANRTALLKELFDTEGSHIGISYLRVSIGASDLNQFVFTYDDMPPGQTDVKMEKFSLETDRADVIPVLKEILAINPKIPILGSPWTAPSWMKTSNFPKAGKLKPEYYDAYALYFVKYIQGMKAEGIRIDAITIQNEPLNEGNTPSLKMLAPEQAVFIKNHLGPAFKAAGIDTKIILYDHNCDEPGYPIAILKDPEAAKYVDGSGFHLYRGKIEAMTQVHEAFPDKHLYFTEQMVTESPAKPTINIAGPVKRLMIGAPRNWSRNVILWNLAADPNNDPHTDNGGCGICQGAITIDGNKVTRNVAYYTMAHASKFVRPGAVRVASDSPEPLPNVAFRAPDGQMTLIAANNQKTPLTFTVRCQDKYFSATLDAQAVGTFVWQGKK